MFVLFRGDCSLIFQRSGENPQASPRKIVKGLCVQNPQTPPPQQPPQQPAQPPPPQNPGGSNTGPLKGLFDDITTFLRGAIAPKEKKEKKESSKRPQAELDKRSAIEKMRDK